MVYCSLYSLYCSVLQFVYQLLSHTFSCRLRIIAGGGKLSTPLGKRIIIYLLHLINKLSLPPSLSPSLPLSPYHSLSPPLSLSLSLSLSPSLSLSSSTGIFVFIYSLFYFYKRSHMYGSLQTVEYFGYTLLVCYVFFLMLGTVGFFSSLIFVRYMYRNLKTD